MYACIQTYIHVYVYISIYTCLYATCNLMCAIMCTHVSIPGVRMLVCLSTHLCMHAYVYVSHVLSCRHKEIHRCVEQLSPILLLVHRMFVLFSNHACPHVENHPLGSTPQFWYITQVLITFLPQYWDPSLLTFADYYIWVLGGESGRKVPGSFH